MNADIIREFAEIPAEIQELRNLRPDAVSQAQASFEALLEADTTLTLAERYAIAAAVAKIHQQPQALALYSEYAEDEPVAAEHQERVQAAIEVAQLLTLEPKAASREVVGHLAQWYSNDDIISIFQLLSFLAFQLRVVHGLRVLAGQQVNSGMQGNKPDTSTWTQTERILSYPEAVHPTKFVRHSLGWLPWIEPLTTDALTSEQWDALINPDRASSPYFRLLARDAAALKARTLTDFDIFYNVTGGLGRAERELAATAASLHNGCEFCTSVHAGRTVMESGNEQAVDALLADLNADLGSAAWNAIRDAAVALTTLNFSAEHIASLQAAGLDDADIIDVINASAFFNWANRLMLGLGEPDVPVRYR